MALYASVFPVPSIPAIDVGFVRVSAEVTEGAAKSPASLSDLRMELVAGFSTQWPPADR